jgi:hypothetical protein
MAKKRQKSSSQTGVANRKKAIYNKRLMALVVSLVVTMASMFGIVSLEYYLADWMLLVLPLTAGVTVFAIFEAALKSNEESSVNKSIQRPISILIPVSLVISTWFAVQSLWVYPFDMSVNRFALENLSTVFLVAGGALALLLSTLQQDRYWVTKRQPGTMDEREMFYRQKVLDKSYIFAVATGAGTLWAYLENIQAIDEIRRIDIANTVVPGHYFFPAYCAVIMLFSIPSIIAVWQNKTFSKK